MAIAPAESPVLGDVVGVLDASVLRIAHPHEGLGAAVAGVSILDGTDPATVHAGAIVLAVGTDPETGDAVALLDRAGRAAAAAVVMRCPAAPPERLAELAGAAGVSLLTVPPEMDWGQLYALLRTAMTGAGAAGGAAGVRVGDLFALADAVAAAVGGPVTVEDPQWRVLAYSNLDAQPIDEARRQTILGRTPPEIWQARLDQSDVRQRLRAGDGVVRFEHDGIAPRLVAPVRAGGELVGSLWVAEGAEPLGSEAEAELRRFADLSAIHLIAHRSADDLRRRSRAAIVRELLDGHLPAGGSRLRAPLSVVAFDHRGWRGDPDRIMSITALYAESVHRDAVCACLDERTWAIVPGDDPAAVAAFAERVVERAEHALHADVRAGIGIAAGSVAELPASRRSAEQALAVLESGRRPGPVLAAADAGAHIALLELLDAAAAIPSLREGRVARLPAEQAATLEAWLDAHGDVAAAAAALGVHPNTLRYRLRKLCEQLDLDDPDERLVAALELRLLRRDAPA